MRPLHLDDSFALFLSKAQQWNPGWLPHEWTPTLVLTNPYGPLPPWLRENRIPMILHQWTIRKPDLESWLGLPLGPRLAEWNLGATHRSGVPSSESFWLWNAPLYDVDLSSLKPEPGGWYPDELVRRILTKYGTRGGVVWDGFMGRGTVGKIAVKEFGMRYIGIDESRETAALAIRHLWLNPTPIDASKISITE